MVLIPEIGTAKPIRRANSSPFVIGRMTGSLVATLNASGDTISTGRKPCCWALEAPGIAPFIGFTGLQHVGASMPFAPAVEIGWRLARAHWGKGYATEGAIAALADGFERLGLSEIVAFAAFGNEASCRVIDRIGMWRDRDGDFDLPGPEKPLRRAALYRIRKCEAILTPAL